MNPELIKILTDKSVFLFIGIVIGFFLSTLLRDSGETKTNKAEEVDDEINGYGNQYYVKIPDNTNLIEILIEEPVAVGHFIVLDKVKYKVFNIEHKVNGHTTIFLNHTHDPK